MATTGQALADTMLETLGGRAAWAGARVVYTRERIRVLALPGEIDNRVWRDLEQPGERAELEGDGVDRVFAWSAAGGSGIKEGEFYRFSEERMERELAFWPVHVSTMYHRLAREDPSLELAVEGERDLLITDASSDELVTRFTISPDGEPVFWNAKSAFDDVSYVYGPVGYHRMPQWGASTDGSWRFELVEFSLSPDEPDVSFVVDEP